MQRSVLKLNVRKPNLGAKATFAKVECAKATFAEDIFVKATFGKARIAKANIC